MASKETKNGSAHGGSGENIINGGSPPHSPTLENGEFQPPAGDDNAVRLVPHLTLINGVTFAIGSIIGSGIFVSPTGVLQETGSVGLSLIIWTLCGVFSMIGAYCFAELGCMIVKSGGDYVYIKEAFGPFLAFLRLWVEVVVVRPCSAAVCALTFAYYVTDPIFTGCEPSNTLLVLLAALCITLLTVVNVVSVRLAARVQDVFTFAKLFALCLIIITGAVMLGKGRVEHLSTPFEYSIWDVGKISLAFYQGLFPYSGWNYLNGVVEELKEPHKNLPRAIWISMTVVTIVYVATNIAYFTLLSPFDVLNSRAVAVSFVREPFGVMWWVMPIFVALSTFGTVNGILFTSSRMYYVGAREGQMPQILCMIQTQRKTPAPAVIITGLITALYLCSTEVYTLIGYVSFVMWGSIGMSVVALLYFRKVRPNAHRPLKVALVWPIIYCIFSLFLVIFPLYQSPFETGMGCVIVATGIPVYFVCIKWTNKPKSLTNFFDKVTGVTQKLMIVVPEKRKKYRLKLV